MFFSARIMKLPTSAQAFPTKVAKVNCQVPCTEKQYMLDSISPFPVFWSLLAGLYQ